MTGKYKCVGCSLGNGSISGWKAIVRYRLADITVEPAKVDGMSPFRDGWDESDVEAVIARGDPAELRYVPLVVSMSPPSRVYAESICRRFAEHPDPNVRGLAIEGFGHIARL